MAKYRATCTPSGTHVVLGMQPAMGTYYSLYSPKWSNLMVIEGKTSDDTRSEAMKARLHDAYQAPFGEPNVQLLRLMQQDSLEHEEEDEEEQVADDLARKMDTETGGAFPIILVFRAIPVTFGNMMCFYENSTAGSTGRSDKADVVLPGFKMIIAKYNQQELNEAIVAISGNDSSCHSNGTATAAETYVSSAMKNHQHNWKSPDRVLSEFAVVEPNLRVLQITDPWKATVDHIEHRLSESTNLQQSIVVCGAKGVGKSTFCRYLVNRLLSHYEMVAFLDTDLGQSELTPPGLVSLHALISPLLGPGFAQMRRPLRSLFCGGTNPGNDPVYYMKAVTSLLRLYEKKWGSHAKENGEERTFVPLVINTDGWIKSMGHDLLCSVIQQANPDHVVQLLAATKNKQFSVPSDGNWKIYSVPPWDPVGVTHPLRSSKELRLYRLHAYFLGKSLCNLSRLQLQNLHVSSEKNRFDAQIAGAYTALTAFAVSFDAVDIAFAGSSVAPSQLLFALNASFVGLCIHPKRQPVAPDSEGPPRILLQPLHAPCVGVGLIRAVDPRKRVLYVLSPLPLAVIKKVNVLVRGTFPIDPLMVTTNDPVQAPYVVADILASDGTGAGAMQSRNNLKRKRDDKSARR